MRQVLELVSSLIACNPQKAISASIKAKILLKALPIITCDSVQPSTKPSFKAIECFLAKGTISPSELSNAYQAQLLQKPDTTAQSALKSFIPAWGALVSAVFHWIGPADIAPAAGKFLVTLFKALRVEPNSQGSSINHSNLWQHWIRQGISSNPHSLENVKNYLFTPLFKLDRPGSLFFLRGLNQQRSISELQSSGIDAHSLLQLAAIDAGKKSGLIEEPSRLAGITITGVWKLTKLDQGYSNLKAPKTKKKLDSVVLDEQAIGALLGNPQDAVRSLAFSVLITSFSSTRPLNPLVLDLLKSHIRCFHSDTDAKFRNEVLSNTKHLIERLRGATALLARELEQSSFKLSHSVQLDLELRTKEQMIHDATELLLSRHQQFLEWYISFLLDELISTASYQRHITALRAVQLLLQSRIQQEDALLTQAPAPANTSVWPFVVHIFNSRSIRLLLDLLMDPFEDVRTSAMDILGLCSPSNFANATGGALSKGVEIKEHDFGLLKDFIIRASNASRKSGRADYADGVARAYKILHIMQPSFKAGMDLIEAIVNQLETKVTVAEQNLAQAVFDAPVHEDFATLR